MSKSRIRILSINLVLALVVVGVGWWGWSALHPAAAKTTTTTTVVSTGDVTSSVSASGTVISPGDVGVSPSVSAQINSITVKVGERVSAGQMLATLDNTSLFNALNQAKSSLALAQLTYAQDKAAADQAIASAKKSLDDATTNAAAKNPTYKVTLDNAAAALSQAKSVYDSYSSFYGPNGITLAWCATLNTINSTCTTLINDYNSYQSAQNSYNNALANYNISLTSDTQTVENLTTAYNNTVATQKYTIAAFKAQHGITVDSPTAADFTVDQAALALAQKNYDAAVVKAPVAGTIASISATVGQNAPTTSSSTVGSVSGLFVLTDVTALQVTASFSEADAAKLVAGQPTTFTFSALPDASATGKLLSVDLLPTVSSGATSYKATFTIDGKVSGLKPGMTVTATVLTGAAYNVLQVASAAVTTRGSGSFVNVITTKNGADVITRTPVVVGLKGDSADQIISGVKSGTKVVLRSSTASTVGSNGFPVTVGGLGGLSGGGGGGRGGGRGGFGG
jgi:membrane fusion protein, macrolide-specific efflux system